MALGGPSAVPDHSDWTFEPLRGPVAAFVSIIGVHTQELLGIIFPITMLLIFRLLLRRTALAIVAVSLLVIVMFIPELGEHCGLPRRHRSRHADRLAGALPGGPAGRRDHVSPSWGCCGQMPLTPQPAGWYLGAMLLSLAFIAAPAFYGFWTSQAGRPLFRDGVLEPEPRS